MQAGRRAPHRRQTTIIIQLTMAFRRIPNVCRVWQLKKWLEENAQDSDVVCLRVTEDATYSEAPFISVETTEEHFRINEKGKWWLLSETEPTE